jgi:hypothetical protein
VEVVLTLLILIVGLVAFLWKFMDSVTVLELEARRRGMLVRRIEHIVTHKDEIGEQGYFRYLD